MHTWLMALELSKIRVSALSVKELLSCLDHTWEYVGCHNISTKLFKQPNLPCTPELWPLNCPKLGFTFSKSKSFHPVFIKLGEYVGGYNIWTKFYNQPNPPCTPKLWPMKCPKLGFPLSKSKSFHPVFIKLGEHVGGLNISIKFYNLPNPPCTPELWPLNCPKTELAVSAFLVEFPAPIEFTTNTTGVFCVSLALLFVLLLCFYFLSNIKLCNSFCNVD